MFFLDITGYGMRKKRCSSVVTWFLQKYLPRHHLEIEVHHRGLLREGVWGWCDVVGQTYRPRSFLIEIHNRLSKEDYTKTLLHEMVHLMDFCKGNLQIKSCRRYYNGIDIEDLEYENQPHETYAHQKEQELYEEYLNHLTHS